MSSAMEALRNDMGRRLDTIGWGFLCLMTGMLLLVPGLPEGAWLVGLGAILLAVNAGRVAAGLAIQWFGVIVGAGAVAAGIGTMAGLDVPVVALFLVACGLALIVSQLRDRAVPA
jgi:hypothetical protein